MTAPFLKVLRPFALLAAVSATLLTVSAQDASSGQGSSNPAATPPPADDKAPNIPLPGTAAQRDTITKSVATLDKFNRIDILGKLLPVVLTKQQIRDLLPAIEKARAKEFEIRVLDAAEILKMDADVTKAIEAGTTKSDVPSVELQTKIRKVTGAIMIRRQIATNEMIDLVYAACQKTLDAGQMKVMASTLEPKLIAPGMKVEGDEQKIRFYIRYIFLDALTYELLLRMQK